MLGGVTGHKTFAGDTGVIVKPAETTQVADAVVRIFIDHGDRTNRAKARLKYILDAWGFDKFVAALDERLGRQLVRAPVRCHCAAAADRSAGAYRRPSAEAGRLLLDRHRAAGGQAHGRADARDCTKSRGEFGDGDIRLTVWQNLLISGVPEARVAEAEAAIAALSLSTKATSIRAGLIACTGNAGCRLAMSDTKRHAETIAQWCETRVQLDSPLNIHLTGCPNSCAQHYIGDIGLLGTKIQATEDGDQAEAYHINVGGGFGPQAQCGREIYRDIKAEDAPRDDRTDAQSLSRQSHRADGEFRRFHAALRGGGA